MENNTKYNSNQWFSTELLKKVTKQDVWNGGVLLYLTQKIMHLEVTRIDNHWQLEGEVQDTQKWPFTTHIKFTLATDNQVASWHSVCTCPVRHQCKHGLALMLKAAHHGLSLLDPAARHLATVAPTAEQIEAEHQAAKTRIEELARIAAETQVLRWMQDLDRTSGSMPPLREAQPATVGGPGQVKEKQEFYLYLLSVVAVNNLKQQLQIEAVVSSRKKNGAWANPKPIRQPPYQGLRVYDQATLVDHEVLQLIGSMTSPYHYNYSHSTTLSGLPAGRVGLITLEQAASTGRLFFKTSEGHPGAVIQWGPPQPLNWDWQEVKSNKTAESDWVLRAKLADTHARLCLNKPPLYLNAAQGMCGLVQAEGIASTQLEVLLNAPPLQPAALQKHQLPLIQRLGHLPLPPVLQKIKTVQGITPTAHLQVSPNAQEDVAQRGLMQARLSFDYAGHRGWWADQGNTVLIDDPKEHILLHRDTQAELNAIARLFDLGLTTAHQNTFGIPGKTSQQNWLQWADDGFNVLHEAGFEVTVDESLHGWITHADALEVQLKPEGDEDDEGFESATSPWFDLSLGMEINGQRYNILPWLPELITTATASPLDPETGLPNLPPFIFLRDPQSNGFIRLPTDTLKPWLAALLELVGDSDYDFSGESLKLSRLDALRTGAALGEGAVWEGAQALRNMVQQLSGRAELSEVPMPASVQASLRPYQQQGVNWLQFLREHGLGGILADDMGLGKTLQTLVHIQIEKDAGRLTHPALIIAPVSLMGNWQRETARFCPQLRSLVLHGKDRHEVADTMSEFDVVIAPYSLLQRDRERWLEAKWHLVVLDEAQNIKNANTYAAQVVGQLQTRHRLCLSGTPMENHLGEIWSLFHFLMPGFLGSQKRFSQLFRAPIEKQGNPERMTQLRARITPFMLRRTKAIVANELPPKVETVMRVELSGKQADLYETIRLGMEKTVREALATKGLAKSQITILDALLKLRQVCCDPHLLKLDAAKKVTTSAKLDRLMELLPEMLAEGRRILLFSQFTSMLTLIEAELIKRKINWVKLTGQSQKRDALIEQFTSGQVPLFLISLKAGGVGLNLPQADTVIHYDPWWNPAVENQATDRAHRIGQTHSVWVVKLVAQGTIEERILALQERKAALAESMYSGSVGRKEPLFNENDLAELLKPLSA